MSLEVLVQKAPTPSTRIIFVHTVEKKPVVKGGSKALQSLVDELFKRGTFKAAANSTFYFPEAPRSLGSEDESAVILAGLGDIPADPAETREHFRLSGGAVARALDSLSITEAWIDSATLPKGGDDAAAAFAEGAQLATYTFNEFRSKPHTLNLKKLVLSVPKQPTKALLDAIERNAILAEATLMARDLGNLPSNELTPVEFSRRAQDIAKKFNLSCTIFDEDRIKKEKMELLHAVGRGSLNPPRFIILEYNKTKKDLPHLVLVGKGLTFDSGGISIKPAAKMEEMKYDMCGGAAVLGATQAIAQLKLPIRLTTLIPSSENMSGDHAYKPGDVIRGHKGVTVEIVNTDAEGRLILADALSYAHQLEPDALIDVATLTGAVVVALENAYTGIMGNHPELIAQLKKASSESGEAVWELPMSKYYEEDLSSTIADIKNTGSRGAGSSKGGIFLRKFVDASIPWAHLDIAGTAWNVEHLTYHRKAGGTGVGVRLLTTLAENFKKMKTAPAAKSKKSPKESAKAKPTSATGKKKKAKKKS